MEELNTCIYLFSFASRIRHQLNDILTQNNNITCHCGYSIWHRPILRNSLSPPPSIIYLLCQIAEAKRSMKHAEVVIARQAVEEGRGLVVVVNKMDLLRGKDSMLYEKVMKAVPEEIQTIIPQVSQFVLFLSFLGF